MKTQELLELAALDALGLLDEGEREAFDLAFRSAPPALQAQIRREQTRIAGDDSLLPKVEAPLGLRARVIAAWREAVEAVSSRRGGGASGRGPIKLAGARGVNPIWRAGAIGCATASIVLAVAVFNIRGQFEQYTATTDEISRQEFFAKEFGARFTNLLFAPTTKLVQFDPSDNGVKAQAMLLIDPETNTGSLFAQRLPQSAGGYALVPLDANGKPMRDSAGELTRLCVIHPANTSSASAFNQKISIEPGIQVGLVAADDLSDSPRLLLRGRNL